MLAIHTLLLTDITDDKVFNDVHLWNEFVTVTIRKVD